MDNVISLRIPVARELTEDPAFPQWLSRLLGKVEFPCIAESVKVHRWGDFHDYEIRITQVHG